MFLAVGLVLLVIEYVGGRLVLDSLDELIIMEGEEKVLDGQRVMREGDLVNTTVRESDCRGVMEEMEVWEVVTVEEGKEIKNHFEITKIIDVVQDTMQIHNAREPWVKGSVMIR